jgi:hypothetical protein
VTTDFLKSHNLYFVTCQLYDTKYQTHETVSGLAEPASSAYYFLLPGKRLTLLFVLRDPTSLKSTFKVQLYIEFHALFLTEIKL